jgi:ABC-type transporter Mla subunit MlaD
MAGLLNAASSLSKTVDNLNTSVENINKISEQAGESMNLIQEFIKTTVGTLNKHLSNIYRTIAYVIITALIINFLLRVETDLIYPALSNAMEVEGSVESVNVRGFLSVFIQTLIVIIPLAVLLYFKKI